MQPILRLFFAVFIVVGSMVPAMAKPKVVATILPVHSLASALMEGVGGPDLLFSAKSSPHRIALRPSQRKALAEADLVFWIGEGLERPLAKVISIIRGRSVSLLRASGISRLTGRSGGVWGKSHEGHGHGHGHGHDDEIDPHIWLDPANARAIVKTMIRELGNVDPKNRDRYKANGEALLVRLEILEKEVGAALSPVQKRPFIVFHDAFQYFERRFRLTAAGSLLVRTGHAPSAKRLFEVRKKILNANVKCVFQEPQFDAKVAKSLVRGTPARLATLDPLGSTLKPGRSAYEALIRNLASDMIGCFRHP